MTVFRGIFPGRFDDVLERRRRELRYDPKYRVGIDDLDLEERVELVRHDDRGEPAASSWQIKADIEDEDDRVEHTSINCQESKQGIHLIDSAGRVAGLPCHGKSVVSRDAGTHSCSAK